MGVSGFIKREYGYFLACSSGMTSSASRMATMKLLMKKYDFLEENPDATKKDINWEDLLYEDKQLVGPRSIKNMIFPWKY